MPKINRKCVVFILPKEISYEEGTFIEPLACVIRGQRLAGVKKGQSILILGSGISGLLHLLLARSKGAGRIIITDIDEYRLKAAKKLGADIIINAREDVLVVADNQFLRMQRSGKNVLKQFIVRMKVRKYVNLMKILRSPKFTKNSLENL